MTYNSLGKSSLCISRIGFGCMSLKFGQEDAGKLLQQALDLGINYFDTADLYEKGANETLLGKALKAKRKEIILATKVGNQWRSDGSGWDWNPRKSYILESVESSLRRLQTDYIDLYQLHGGTIDDPIDETIEAFELLVQQGKVRYYGISSIRLNVIRKWIERSNIVSVMMQYSLLDRRPEEIFPLLQQKKISVLARGSVAQGLLAGKESKSYLNYSPKEVAQAAGVIGEIAGTEASAQTAIRFALQNPVVASVVVGIRTEQQLRDAVAAGKQVALSQKDFLRLSNAIPANQY